MKIVIILTTNMIGLSFRPKREPKTKTSLREYYLLSEDKNHNYSMLNIKTQQQARTRDGVIGI